MSLRMRILVLVATINVVVTVLLAGLFAVDRIELQSAHRVEQQRAAQRLTDQLQLLFGGFVNDGHLVLETADPAHANSAQICQRFLQHPVQRIISDGIFVRRTTYYLDEEEERQSDFLMNLIGAKGRGPDFREGRARSAIADAIEQNQIIEDGPWLAAPIYLEEFGGRVTKEDSPFGGIYVRLSSETAEPWQPSFEGSLYWVMGIATFFMVAVTWLLLDRWVLRPLTALGRGADRVAESRYDEPVEGQHRGDEVGRLIASFNAMMAEVRLSQEDLQERVATATERAEADRRGLVIAQRLAATGTLASGIAHEINNPLGGMINATRRLQKELEKPQANESVQRQYLELLTEGLQRIQEIARRVLTFSPRIMEPEPIDLRDVVERAVAFADHRARKHQISIEVTGEHAEILAVAGEIQQVILNLLLNACDAMENTPGRVDVEIRRDQAFVEVSIRDCGPGMTDEERERAFDLFFTTKEVGRGTGLGLSVAYHIVNQHGGKIDVESELGHGTTFRVRFPRTIEGPSDPHRAQ